MEPSLMDNEKFLAGAGFRFIEEMHPRCKICTAILSCSYWQMAGPGLIRTLAKDWVLDGEVSKKQNKAK